jgi:phosphopantothenoylcysteine decarboxylase/phosphopantothenate--cysteine ligase
MSVKKRVLLIVSGGIAAYKSLELVRNLKNAGIAIRCILTPGGAQFVTTLSLATLSEDKVYEDLFSVADQGGIGHIELSRNADLLVVAPATADIIAKMRAGIADDLATAALLATDKPVLIAPAMNVRMWVHEATQENMAVLSDRGVNIIGPDEGDMACGEYGMGRMSEPDAITIAIKKLIKETNSRDTALICKSNQKLAGKKALVTSGPTHEPLDPVRYIANRSSGRQGHAIAAALAKKGADTVMISGPTNLSDPIGVIVRRVGSAVEMFEACKRELPADILVCAAAVADWRALHPTDKKIKKNGVVPTLELTQNPDILSSLSQSISNRPRLVVGFAAETGSVVDKALDKLARKKCDWMIANDVSVGTQTFGGTKNTVHIVDQNGIENWPEMSKESIGDRLADRIANHLNTDHD